MLKMLKMNMTRSCFVVRLSCVMAAFLLAGFSASESKAENSRVGVDLGYYRNLSGMAFLYGAQLYGAIEDKSESIKVARELSFAMFCYWFNTRHGKLAPSKSVDLAIVNTYAEYFSGIDFEPNEDPFADPLAWGTGKEPRLRMAGDADNMTKKEYEDLLANFQVFLRQSESDSK